jgi:hypothetical protein
VVALHNFYVSTSDNYSKLAFVTKPVCLKQDRGATGKRFSILNRFGSLRAAEFTNGGEKYQQNN